MNFISRCKPRGEVSIYTDESIIPDGAYPSWFEDRELTFYQALDVFIKAKQLRR